MLLRSLVPLALFTLFACSDSTTASACPDGIPQGVVALKAKARCLADSPAPPSSAVAPSTRAVVLYVDRSASMQGFLDPAYPTRIKTDFRSVLDVLLAGLRPTAVRSYGAAISAVPADIGVLGRKSFYHERDTRMEDVVAEIARDSGQVSIHLIVGDGRRGSPALADGQYVALRAAALAWIDGGGSFLVGASMAPFRTVPSDPSGCRRGADVAAEQQTCPIYLFAFLPKGSESAIATAVSDAFEHLFMWPAMTLPPAKVGLLAEQTGAKLNVNPIWERAAGGEPIIRTEAQARTTTASTYRIGLVDSSTAELRAYGHLLAGTRAQTVLTSRGLAGGPQQPWGDASGGTLVRLGTRPTSVQISSFGLSVPTSIIRASVVPLGEPTWLDQVDAEGASDIVRTYGIGRLFEPFRQRAKQTVPPPMATLFLVPN